MVSVLTETPKCRLFTPSRPDSPDSRTRTSCALQLVITVEKRKKQQFDLYIRLGLRSAMPDPLDTWLDNSCVRYFTPPVPLSRIDPESEVLVDIWTKVSHVRYMPIAFPSEFPDLRA